MLRLLSFKAQEGKDFWKPSKLCHVGIHGIALAEYSQMSTHVPRLYNIIFISLKGLLQIRGNHPNKVIQYNKIYDEES